MKSKLSIFLTVMIVVMGLFASQAMAADPTLSKEEKKFLSYMDYNNVEEVLRHLSEEIGNRRTGSIGTDKAAEYFVERLRSWGYEPIVQEYDNTDAVYDSAANAGNRLNHGHVEVGGKQYMYFGPTYNANTAYAFTNETVDIAGAVVMTWSNTGEDFSFGSADVNNKAVFVKLGDGPTENRAAADAPTAARYYNSALALQKAGAKAVIFQWREPRRIVISPLPPHNGKPTGTDATYARIGNTTSSDNEPITIPVGNTHYFNTNAILSDLGPATPLKVNMRTRSDGKNIIAILPSATGSKKIVCVVAHYDTVDNTSSGANDNGSGSALVMEMARAFKQSGAKLEHNVIFALFGTEEGWGMRGSRNFVMKYVMDEPENFIGAYNMDQVTSIQPEAIYFNQGMFDGDGATVNGVRTPESRLSSILERLSRESLGLRMLDDPEGFSIANTYLGFQHIYLAIQKQHFSARHKNKKIAFKMSGWDPYDYDSYERDPLTGGYIYDDFNMLYNFIIGYGSSSDHRSFNNLHFHYNFPENTKNATQQFSWRYTRTGRPGPTGNALEIWPHTAGDVYISSLSRPRLEVTGDSVALAAFFSAGGSVEMESVAPTKPFDPPYTGVAIADLDPAGVTLNAEQDDVTGDVNVIINHPNLYDGCWLTFFFYPESNASESVAVLKQANETAGTNVYKATLTYDELKQKGLKPGTKYAVQYSNENGTIVGYSTFTNGGFTFVKQADEKEFGGCNAGYALIIALLAIVPYFVRRKR